MKISTKNEALEVWSMPGFRRKLSKFNEKCAIYITHMHWTVLFWFYIILVSDNLGALFHRSIFLIYYLFIFCRKYSFLLKCHYYCLKINALKNLKEIMNTRCFWWVFDTLNYIMQEYFFAWLKSKLYALDIFFWFYIILVKKNSFIHLYIFLQK